MTLDLAGEVARQLMAGNALAAHSRDELGISEHTRAKPIQAALTSAATFTSGAVIPLIVMLLSPRTFIVWSVSVVALVLLGILGAIAAVTGGAHVSKAVIRVAFWGALALGVTAAVGHIAGAFT